MDLVEKIILKPKYFGAKTPTGNSCPDNFSDFMSQVGTVTRKGVWDFDPNGFVCNQIDLDRVDANSNGWVDFQPGDNSWLVGTFPPNYGENRILEVITSGSLPAVVFIPWKMRFDMMYLKSIDMPGRKEVQFDDLSGDVYNYFIKNPSAPLFFYRSNGEGIVADYLGVIDSEKNDFGSTVLSMHDPLPLWIMPGFKGTSVSHNGISNVVYGLSSGNRNPYLNTVVNPYERDIVPTFSHESGHLLGFGHCGDDHTYCDLDDVNNLMSGYGLGPSSNITFRRSQWSKREAP